MTLAAVLAIGSIVQAQPDDRPRIREELSNGVKLLTSNQGYVGSGKVCLVVYASAQSSGVPASGRHLLEHISAKGSNKDVDRRLETVGVLLQADSTRNGTWFLLSGSADQLPVMVDCVKDILGPLKTTAEELKREISILHQERAVQAPWWPFDSAAWKVAFGENSTDPFGIESEFAAYTPDTLETVRKSAYSGGAVSCVAFGDINPAIAMDRLKSAVSALPVGADTVTPRAVESFVGRARAGQKGEARSSVVPGLDSSQTATTVAVALVLARKLGGSVAYEPAFGPGVVTLYSPSLAGLSGVEAVTQADNSVFIAEVRSASRSWWYSLTNSLESRAKIEALFLRDGASLRLEVLSSFGIGATDREILEALQSFQIDRCIQVNGQ